jgi:DNA-binding protein HU-beta
MLHQQMTKEELCRELAQAASVSEDAVRKLLAQLACIAAQETSRNGGFLLPEIGMIENVQRSERTGVNPLTGEKIQLKAKLSLRFQFAAAFKKKVSAE